MRLAMLMGILALTVHCTASRSGSDSVEMSTIARGNYAAAESQSAVVAKSSEEYRRLWQELIGGGEEQAAEVDFSTGAVAFLLAGSRPSGGWSIEPETVSVESDGTAVIVAKIKGPPAGAMVTQALTSPYAVVLVRDPNVKKVRWTTE